MNLLFMLILFCVSIFFWLHELGDNNSIQKQFFNRIKCHKRNKYFPFRFFSLSSSSHSYRLQSFQLSYSHLLTNIHRQPLRFNCQKFFSHSPFPSRVEELFPFISFYIIFFCVCCCKISFRIFFLLVCLIFLFSRIEHNSEINVE